MTDSLILAEAIELIGAPGGVASTNPKCAGAFFRLMPGYDLGSPVPTTDIVGSLLLDGERPFGRRAGNRTITLPVKISAPDFLTLAAAREVLLSAIDAQFWTLRWTRDTSGPLAGGTTPLPMMLDCFRAQASVLKYGGPDQFGRATVALLSLTFQALPYGRSDLPVITEFPSPLLGKTAPPAPVTIDSYSTVTGTHWSQSLVGPGPFSAFWTTGGSGVGTPAVYTRSGIGPFNLQGLGALTVFAGFGSTAFFPNWGNKGGPVTFAFTLSDGTHSVSGSFIRRVKSSNNSAVPVWTKIRVPIPASSTVNFAAITGYTITVTSRAAGDLAYTELYLSSLTAVPGATALPSQPTAGVVYDMAGILGTARTPVSLQVQQPGTATTVRQFTTAGAGQWLCPAGVTTVKAECWGGAGGGTPPAGSLGGAGGGGGEYAAEATLAVTPGTVYSFTVGTAGNGTSGTNGGNTTFAGDSVTVTAHGGKGAANGSAGGTGSANTIHHNGGAGGTNGGFQSGGGGGSSGGSAAAGGAGGNATSNIAPGAGGVAPAGAGAGGGFVGANLAKAPAIPGGAGAGASPGAGYPHGMAGATGQIVLTFTGTPTFKTLIAHRPAPDAPETLTPFVSPLISDVPDGTTEYPVQSQVAGLNARFDGTYTVVLVSNSWHSPSASRNLSVTVNQYEQPGGASYSTTAGPLAVVPNSLPGPFAVIGEVTLPVNAMAADNLDGYFTVTVTSSDTADRFQDVLFLDTMGQTVIIQSSTGYANYYLDEPATDRDLGNIMGSVFDRADAVSVLDRGTVAGPTLYADPFNNQQLLLYAAEGAPSCEMIYFPRYWLDRTA